MKLRRSAQYMLVTAVSLVIWLFAEAESVGLQSEAAQVRFQASDDWFIQTLPGPDGERWGGGVTVELRGSKSALSAARDALSTARGTLFISPGEPGVARRSGEQTVSLREAIQGHPRLRDIGVTVDAVRPPEVRVEVQQLVEEALPIEVMLPGIATEGPVLVEPDRATLRIRQDVLSAYGGVLPSVLARPTGDQLENLPPTGEVTRQVALRLPQELIDAAGAGVQLVDKAANVRFTVRSLVESFEVPSVPVWVRVPAIEAGRYDVALDENDRLLRVTLSGSPAVLAPFRAGSDAIIAILTLDSGELANTDVQTKRVTFGTRSGVSYQRLAIESENPVVSFTVRPAQQDGNVGDAEDVNAVEAPANVAPGVVPPSGQ